MPILTNLDRSESVFFERELDKVKTQTYDIKYPELMARTFVPVATDVPSGAEKVTYQQFDRTGRAAIIQAGATDSPRVDVLGQEFTRPVRHASASYGWNLIEIRSSMMAGKALETRRASAARRAVEELLDEVASIGAPEYGIPTGFLNHSSVAITAATGAWSTLTADQIIADVSALWQATATDTKGIERPDTLVLPDAQHALIASLPRSTVSDTTVLEFILRSYRSRGLTAIEPWYRLAGAGVGAVDRGVMYRRSADHVTQDIVQEFEQLPVHQRGMNFEVMTFASTAGTAFYYPRSARYIDGI